MVSEVQIIGMVRARYVLDLRKKEVQMRAQHKTAKERKELNTVLRELNELKEKIFGGNASKKDFERVKELRNKLNEIRTTISKKTAVERAITRGLTQQIRTLDNVIVSLLGIDYKTEVEAPVDESIRRAQPELAGIVVFRGAPAAEGGC